MRILVSAGHVVQVFKRESLVACSKGSFRSGLLRAVQSKEGWVLWASKALGTVTLRSWKRRADSIAGRAASGQANSFAGRAASGQADSIRLTADGP